MIQTAIREQWIRTVAVVASNLLSVLRTSLDPGEAEAIALAADLKVDLIIVDEQEARQFAASAGFRVTGVLGVLLRAKFAGSIPAVRPEIQALRKNARFLISAALEASVLEAAGE